jgi:hypothetical protein
MRRRGPGVTILMLTRSDILCARPISVARRHHPMHWNRGDWFTKVANIVQQCVRSGECFFAMAGDRNAAVPTESAPIAFTLTGAFRACFGLRSRLTCSLSLNRSYVRHYARSGQVP